MSPNFPGSVLDPALDDLSWEERYDLGTTNYTDDQMFQLFTNHHENYDENGSEISNDLGLGSQIGLGNVQAPGQPHPPVTNDHTAVPDGSYNMMPDNMVPYNMMPYNMMPNIAQQVEYDSMMPNRMMSDNMGLNNMMPDNMVPNSMMSNNMMPNMAQQVGYDSTMSVMDDPFQDLAPMSAPPGRQVSNSSQQLLPARSFYAPLPFSGAPVWEREDAAPTVVPSIRPSMVNVQHRPVAQNNDMGQSTSKRGPSVSDSSFSPSRKRARIHSNSGSNGDGNKFTSSLRTPPPTDQRHKIPVIVVDDDSDEDSDDLSVSTSPTAKGKEPARTQNNRTPKQPHWIRKIIGENFKAEYLDAGHQVQFYRNVNPRDWIGRESGFPNECARIRALEESAQKALEAKAKRDGKKACGRGKREA